MAAIIWLINMMIERIISLQFILIILLQIQRYKSSSLLESINNSSIVTGTCSRPNLPPTGRIRFASMEKVKFAENETIYILCEENQFPHQAQKRKCHHGRWLGKQARCGK